MLSAMRNSGGQDRDTVRQRAAELVADSMLIGLLRDRFAMAALTGFAQHNGWIGYMSEPKHRQFIIDSMVRDAFAIADAAITERAKESP